MKLVTPERWPGESVSSSTSTSPKVSVTVDHWPRSKWSVVKEVANRNRTDSHETKAKAERTSLICSVTSPSDGEPSAARSSRSEGKPSAALQEGHRSPAPSHPQAQHRCRSRQAPRRFAAKLAPHHSGTPERLPRTPPYHLGQLLRQAPACSRRPLPTCSARERAALWRPSSELQSTKWLPLQGKTSARKPLPNQSVFWAAGPPTRSAARAFASLCGSARLCFPTHPEKPLSQTHVCQKTSR